MKALFPDKTLINLTQLLRTDSIDHLLKSNVKINARDENGNTALMIAVKSFAKTTWLVANAKITNVCLVMFMHFSSLLTLANSSSSLVHACVCFTCLKYDVENAN